MVAQFCKCTKNHWVVYPKWIILYYVDYNSVGLLRNEIIRKSIQKNAKDEQQQQQQQNTDGTNKKQMARWQI